MAKKKNVKGYLIFVTKGRTYISNSNPKAKKVVVRKYCPAQRKHVVIKAKK